MKLTLTERWLLSNQCLILAKLYPEEGDHYNSIREALDNGYERHYAPEHITKDGPGVMTEDDCQEVIDILNMFSFLRLSFKQLKDSSGIKGGALDFDGFDGNEETKHMAYARYYCSLPGGRFTDIARAHDLNSHSRRLPRYRAMLAEYEKIKERKPQTVDIAYFTKEEIQTVLSAKGKW